MAISKIVYKSSPSATPETWMDVTQKTVTSSTMLNGTTSLKNDGTDITGNIQSQAAQTIHPSTSDQTVASGKYLSGTQTIKGVVVSNTLTAENIKKDVVVKIGDSTDDDCVTSVTGTYEGGGGGIDWDDIASMSEPSGDVVLTVSTVESFAFAYRENSPDWRVFGPNVTYVGQNAFRNCFYLTEAHFPQVSSYHNTSYIFYMYAGSGRKLALLDWGVANVPGNFLVNCKSLTTLILRKTSIATLANVGTLNGTPFASGGSGGTIYIPKSLYDHLGDGGSSDYKAASNWSTIDGYGTITSAKIEGSIYEL